MLGFFLCFLGYWVMEGEVVFGYGSFSSIILQ